jgi:hypothetical protein
VSDGTAPVAQDERQWQLVARIRAQTSGWVLIWSARKGEFQARPLFRAPMDTVATGHTPEELAERMLEIEVRAGRTESDTNTSGGPPEPATHANWGNPCLP